jgi:hypothetical protein
MLAVKTLSRIKAKSDARHLMRYLLSQAGTEIAEIAKRENVSVKTVKESIAEWERYAARNSEGQMQLAIRDMIITTTDRAKDTLDGLLKATTFIDVKQKNTGMTVSQEVEDKITRLEALKVYTGLLTASQPKVPQIVNNNSNTQQTAVLSSAETTEERMRRLKASAAQHNLLPPVVTGVPELIDKGFDPDDDDGEEDDDE